MEARPTGIVTFLFTGLEGSTRLWEDDAIAARGDRCAGMARIEIVEFPPAFLDDLWSAPDG